MALMFSNPGHVPILWLKFYFERIWESCSLLTTLGIRGLLTSPVKFEESSKKLSLGLLGLKSNVQAEHLLKEPGTCTPHFEKGGVPSPPMVGGILGLGWESLVSGPNST